MKLNEKQLAQVDRQIKRLVAGDSYYGKILKEKKIKNLVVIIWSYLVLCYWIIFTFNVHVY